MYCVNNRQWQHFHCSYMCFLQMPSQSLPLTSGSLWYLNLCYSCTTYRVCTLKPASSLQVTSWAHMLLKHLGCATVAILESNEWKIVTNGRTKKKEKKIRVGRMQLISFRVKRRIILVIRWSSKPITGLLRWYWNNNNSREQLVLIVSEVEQLDVRTGPDSVSKDGEREEVAERR